MPLEIESIEIGDLTQAKLDGTGVFDVLMRANKAHLQAEFDKQRIKGPEYATVYLGSLDRVMQTALSFLLSKDEAALKAALVEQQVKLAEIEVLKADIQKQILAAELAQMPAKLALLEAQAAVAQQQKLNLVAEALNIPKQGELIDAQKARTAQETVNLTAEKLLTDKKVDLTAQQILNAVTENTVLIQQECKLRAEYDLLLQQKLKAVQETSLLLQKVASEKAQTISSGVDPDSIVGRQKGLYLAQAQGFEKDAIQKAAKLMADTWNVRRSTDEGTVADGTNLLNDAAVGRAITKMLASVGA